VEDIIDKTSKLYFLTTTLCTAALQLLCH